MSSIDISHPTSAPPTLEQRLEGVPEDIRQFVLKRFHATVFAQELVKEKITPATPSCALLTRLWSQSVGQIEEGTYAGTQLALTEMYDRIEHA
jgi:hypothetical protein